MKKQTINILRLLLVLLSPLQNADATEPDWSDYDALLATHVDPGTRNGINLHLVDYSAWKHDKHWPILLKKLADFKLAQLNGKDEKLAFWINAYNIMAIHMVLKYEPVNSIRDIGNWLSPVWKKNVGIIAGRMRTLHEIEHEILRPMSEPRIHFAIVCASVSCPDLRKTAYRSENLTSALQKQHQAFISNPGKGARLIGDTIHISKIFDWFEKDFTAGGGITAYLPQGLGPTFKHVKYLRYDWSLNKR